MDRILRILSRVTALLFKLKLLKNGCDGRVVVFLEARAQRIIGAENAEMRGAGRRWTLRARQTYNT